MGRTQDYYGVVLFVWQVTREGNRGIARQAIAYADAVSRDQAMVTLRELLTEERSTR